MQTGLCRMRTQSLAAASPRSGKRFSAVARRGRGPACVEENKMSYHIEINEYQRRLIMKALTSTDVNQFSQAPGSGDAFDTEAKEFVCLVQMFGTLDLDDTAPGAEALFRVQM